MNNAGLTLKNRFQDLLKEFPLMVVTESSLCEDKKDFLKRISEACRLGVRLVQFREKFPTNHAMTRSEKFILASAVKKITEESGAMLFINGDVELAWELEADGIHFPERVFHKIAPPPEKIKGYSVHSQGFEKRIVGADYIIFGNIYETESKIGLPGKGLNCLKELTEEVPFPVIGIGGITSNNARECMKSGASGVAVVSAVMQAPSIIRTVEEFKRVLCTN